MYLSISAFNEVTLTIIPSLKVHVLHIAKTSIYDSSAITNTDQALDFMRSTYGDPTTWHYTDPVSGMQPDLHHGIFRKSLGGGKFIFAGRLY